MFRVLLSLTLVPTLLCSAQQTVTPAQLAVVDAKLNKWYPANRPGVAVLLVQDGQVVFKKGYGLANVKSNTPIQPDMAFRIGSITKQFTAAAVMKLVEEGKIDLQAPVSRYVEKLPATWKAITVEQLLTHTSGLPNYTDIEASWESMDKPFKPAKLLETYIGKLPLNFEPGTQYGVTTPKGNLRTLRIAHQSKVAFGDLAAVAPNRGSKPKLAEFSTYY